MRTYLGCYACLVRQTLDVARMAGADEEQQRILMNRVLGALQEMDPASTPPEISDRIHQMVREEVGNGDPYRQAKAESTRQALELYPKLRRLVDESPDPLGVALRLAIAGNIIDFGPVASFDLKETIERVLVQPYAIDDGPDLRRELAQARWLLYLGDNAGETVFDRVLIETLDVPVTYVVKGAPVINDATMEDARSAGLDKVATLVSNGSGAPGTILERTSPEFRRLYEEAELIIAKGQGNYETLSDEEGPLFFLLQTKCPVISRDMGVPEGSIVLKRAGNGRERGPAEL